MKIYMLLLFFVVSGVCKAQVSTAPASNYPGIAVIELFTSQGDINCPPADQLLSEIIADAAKNNKPVYCLAMHVDFWNRYGWKDPFSSLKYTTRLTNYTSVLGMKETYTPLMILNGRTIVETSDRKKAFEMIKTELSKKAVLVPEFTFQIFDDTLDVTYDVNSEGIGGKAGSDKYISMAIVEKGLITEIKKGDNAGKTLTNDNVTRLLFTADLKTSRGLLRIPLKKLKTGENKTLILFIQDKSSRKILGATARKFK